MNYFFSVWTGYFSINTSESIQCSWECTGISVFEIIISPSQLTTRDFKFKFVFGWKYVQSIPLFEQKKKKINNKNQNFLSISSPMKTQLLFTILLKMGTCSGFLNFTNSLPKL